MPADPSVPHGAPSRYHFAKARLNPERRTLEVTWNDGHPSSYPLTTLRMECPCAGCRTAREEAKSSPFRVLGANQKPPSAEVVGLGPVGSYALQFTWKDGHDSGIYTFDFLRELCPCDECAARRTPDDRPYVHGIHIPGEK